MSRGEPVLDAQGASAVPGLWDAHVHLDLVAAQAARIDLSDTRSPEDALVIVARELGRLAAAGRSSSSAITIQGFGHRLSQWSRLPTTDELDAVTGDIPTALISGDVHSGWVNSAVLRILGLPDPRGPLMEEPWFSVLTRLDEVPGTTDLRESGFRGAFEDALARGITGIVDMTEPHDPGEWPARCRRLALPVIPRIRASVYMAELDAWERAGLRTGDPLAGEGDPASSLLTQGSLKIIVDGSLGAKSAWTNEAYPMSAVGPAVPDDGHGTHGVESVARDDLVDLLRRARCAGLDAAVHAIGDAALEDAAHALTVSGAHGRVEHAQLLPSREGDRDVRVLEELIAHGIEFSVQPAHMLDDDATVDELWPGRRSRCFAFAEMVGAGGLLQLGSDAPVAQLDPWLSMATAVSRRVPSGEVWSPLERLSPEEALAASVDGQGPLGVGSRGDLVLLDRDPTVMATSGTTDERIDATAARLRDERPIATVIAGRIWRRT